MQRWTMIGLLSTGLGFGLPAHGQDWSLGVDLGHADMRGDGELVTRFDRSFAAHLDYWLTPHFAIEGNAAYANGHTKSRSPFFSPVERDRDWHSYGLGLRTQWALGAHAFVFGTIGASYDRIRRERPRFNLTLNDDLESTIQVRFVDAPDIAPYAGLGFGWRWNERWNSTIAASRTFGHSAFGCDIECDFRRASRFNLVTAGIDYAF